MTPGFPFPFPDHRMEHAGKSRRNFLKAGSAMAAGSLLLPAWLRASSSTRVKNIGIQLYTVRKEMLEDAAGTLRQLARIGYRELESARSEKGNYYGLSPLEIKKITSDLGMKLVSGHVHADKDFERSVEQAAESGQQYLISAVLPTEGQTVSNYQQAADQFNKLGEMCKKAKLEFGYHNHESEFEVVDGQVLYDTLLDRCEPNLVKMEMDLGWVVAAGHDPLVYFQKYPGRFPLWHLKDVDTSTKKSTELGKGQVKITELLQHSKDSGLKHFFLEQEDYSHTAMESVIDDFSYLKSLDY